MSVTSNLLSLTDDMISADKTTTKFDINIISKFLLVTEWFSASCVVEKMGASRDERTRHTISGDTLCDQPELQAGYYHVGGYGDKVSEGGNKGALLELMAASHR